MMKAIGFDEHLPIDDGNSLFEFNTSIPKLAPHDLLVKVNAISVNPVDIGVRKAGRGKLTKPKIIGWDAVGTVVDVGYKVGLFKKGDRVYYAGSFKRPGSDAEYQAVDERIVGNAPDKLSDAEAAAMPLTSLTAYEALFEQMKLAISNVGESRSAQKTILIINGAGGVGSIAIQLAKLAGLQVITTASRPESEKWVKNYGADIVVNHRKDLVSQIRKIGVQYVDYILELNDIDGHWDEMCELIKPAGRIVSVTENKRPINLRKLMKKRGHFSWEWMYSKSYYQTDDMKSQHDILNRIAELLDEQKIKSTLNHTLKPINAENLRKAHQIVEGGHTIGKVVITGGLID